MAYTADINIVVRGARELAQLQTKLKETAAEIRRVDDVWKGAVNGPKTLNSFNKALQEASTQLRLVKQGTDAETTAVENYVRALNLANAARERQNRLIANQIAKQRTVTATANAGFGIQGPALPPVATRASKGGLSGRDVVSNAVIGGAFPLLFGQGGGAAAGGAIGGLVGGAFGGAGGFAGSLLGTLIGDIASQGQKIKELGQDIGFSAQQTKQLETAFAAAGREADKFQAAVQNIRGLGLSIEDQADAINLAAVLTEKYGGNIDRVAAAYADFVEKGKVGIADINRFTSQGIPILTELEKKYKTNRDGVLALAKDGKITAQALSDALIAVAKTSDETNRRIKSGWAKVWDDLNAGATLSVRSIVAVFSTLVGKSTDVTGDIFSLFSGLYRRMIEGAVDAGARISRVLAATARAAANYAATVELGGLNIGATVGKKAAKGAEGIFTALDQQLQALRATSNLEVGGITVPGQAPDSGKRKAKEKKERESRVPQLLIELDLAKKLRDIRERIMAAELADDKETVIRLQLEERLAQIDGKRLEIMASKDPLQEKMLQVQILMVEADEARAKAAQDFIKYQDEQLRKSLEILGVTKSFIEETNRMGAAAFGGGTGAGAFRTDLDLLGQQKAALDEIQKKYPQIGQAAQSAADMVTSGVAQMVSGTTSLQQVFSDFLQSIGDMLIQSASQMIATYLAVGIARLFAFGGSGFKAPDLSTASGSVGFNPAAFGMPMLARAAGGPVNGQQPYMVGERGPELFVPGTGGSVVPTNDLRAAMGSAPGSSGAPVLNMSFETSTINGVEYVSRDQLEAAMAATRRQAARDGAQRGMTMTLDRLQQSPNTRRRVGF